MADLPVTSGSPIEAFLAAESDIYSVQEYLLVVTWYKVARGSGTATFQLLLSTDWKNTYATFIYDDRAIKWVFKLDGQVVSDRQNYNERV